MTEEQTVAAGRHENPLVPDERLREIYTAMVHMRLLEEHLVAKEHQKKAARSIDSVRGEEAARASTALSLGSGDLILDYVAAPGMKLLLGAELSSLTGTTGAGNHAGSTRELPRTLPIARDAKEQVQRAVGAAAALKVQGQGRAVLVYIQREDLRRKEWKRALEAAGSEELPLIFVALPSGPDLSSSAGELAERSRGWGVPGFPVDGSDAIALYRVMQESLLRARSGGGPALLECLSFHLKGQGRKEREDPLQRLEELLVIKGVAGVAWIKGQRLAFLRLLRGRRRGTR